MAFFELHINCFLKLDTPLEIIHTLQYMISKERFNEPEYVKYSKFELFKDPLWNRFLISDIPHFPFVNSSTLSSNSSGKIFSVHCSFMNKDNKIINDFLKWLTPYLDLSKTVFIGYYREFERTPIIIL